MPLILRLAVLALASLPVFAQDAVLKARLDHVASVYQQQRHFIGSVLVASHGNIVLENGYGMANVELDVPNSPATKFRLGSITKQFTAAAIMQLQEHGKLAVTDRACNYIDACPDAWKAITIHQLLSHTSGIPSYTEDKEFTKPRFMRVPLSPSEVLLLSKDKPLEFEPGTKWKYDNSGYIFLGVIIEKVSGEKYADYVQKHIFGPLDMTDSGYDDTKAILKHRASGYRPVAAGWENADYLDMTLPYAAGSLYSTVRDLYRWDRSWYTAKVLTKSSRDAMTAPVKNEYGYGLQTGPMFNHPQVGHGGGINGFSSYIERFPDDDTVVIVLSNNQVGNAGAVAKALAGTLFGQAVALPGEQKEISIDSKILDRYTGSYQVGPMFVTVTNEDGHLMVQPKGQPKLQAFPSSETQFFLKVVDAVLTFTPGVDGQPAELKFEQNGGSLSGKRVN